MWCITYYFLIDVGDGHSFLKYRLHLTAVLGIHFKVPHRCTDIGAYLLNSEGGRAGGEGGSDGEERKK